MDPQPGDETTAPRDSYPREYRSRDRYDDSRASRYGQHREHDGYGDGNRKHGFKDRREQRSPVAQRRDTDGRRGQSDNADNILGISYEQGVEKERRRSEHHDHHRLDKHGHSMEPEHSSDSVYEGGREIGHGRRQHSESMDKDRRHEDRRHVNGHHKDYRNERVSHHHLSPPSKHLGTDVDEVKEDRRSHSRVETDRTYDHRRESDSKSHSHSRYQDIVSSERHISVAKSNVGEDRTSTTQSHSRLIREERRSSRHHRPHSPERRSRSHRHESRHRGRSSSRGSLSSSDSDTSIASGKHASSSGRHSRRRHTHSHGRNRHRSVSRSRSRSRSNDRDVRDKDEKKRKRRHRSESRDKKRRKRKEKEREREKEKEKSRKKEKEREEERRSVLTGKKIKLKVKLDKDDIEREKNRKDLLMFLNSTMG